MKKNLLVAKIAGLIFLLSGILNQLHAQDDIFPEPLDLRYGYIITLANDSVIGFVDYKPNTRRYLNCRIEIEDTIMEIEDKLIEYKLYQVREFGFYNSKHFSTRIVADKVVEVIVSGSLSLYKEGTNYLLGLEGQDIVPLSKKEKKNEAWKSEIAELIAEYPVLIDELKETTYSTAGLSAIVIKYNELGEGPFRTYDLDINKASFHIGLAGGMSRSVIKSKVTGYAFNYLNSEIAGSTPSVNLFLQYAVPRIAAGLYYQLEIEMSKTKIESYFAMNEPEGVHYYEANLSVISLHLPFTVNYKIPIRKYDFFIQAGAGYQLNLSSDTYLKEEIVFEGIVESFERDLLSVNSSHFSALGGIGVEHRMGPLKGGVLARYIFYPSFSETELYSSNMNRFNIALYIYL